MKQILIVDDDQDIGNMLEETLQKEGYATMRAYSGTEAVLILDSKKPDLILLDLMLPGLSGEEVLPRIKRIPVIVMSAKADIESKISLLTNGAVDYVTKPFAIKELLARVAIHLRSRKAPEEPDILRFDRMELNTDTRSVTVDQKAVRLTRTEFAILKLLMQNPTQILSKSVLLDRISIDTPDCTESSLKTHISHLRQKLKELSGKDYIEAVWGIGFRLKK